MLNKRISHLFPAFVWITLLLLTACQPVQAAGVTAQKGNLSAEEQFRQVVLAKEAAFYANDLDRYLTFFSDDTVSMPPDALPTTGKAALKASMVDFYNQYTASGQVKLISIDLHGDFATRRLEAHDTYTPKAGGAVIHQTSSCVASWKKINGEWKIVWEIWTVEPLPQ